MPNCQNCGAAVSKRYVRVVTPRDVDEPLGCPRCPDMTRDKNGRVRKKRYS